MPIEQALHFEDPRWKKPFISIGHAGAGHLAVPNTLASIELALSIGVDAVEFDVRRCKDDLVLFHDDAIYDPGAKHLARVSDLALERLKWISSAHSGHAIITLSEALEAIEHRALINIDLKEMGIEKALVKTIEDRLTVQDILMSSNYPASLRRLRVLDKRVNTAISYPKDIGQSTKKTYLRAFVNSSLSLMRGTLRFRIKRLIEKSHANAIMLYQKLVTQEAVQYAHAAGYKVFVWTIDDLSQMRLIRGMGVDGIASNDPRLFKEV